MKVLFSIVAILGISQAPAFATSNPAPALVDSIQINGSGCFNQYVSWDQWDQVIQARTPDFSVQLDGNLRFARKNCQAMLDIVKPHGWTYRVSEVEVSGWAQLSGSVEAKVSNYHYIQGQQDSPQAELNIGPWYYNHYKLVNKQAGEWAPCNSDRILNVNTAIMLRRKDSNPGNSFLKLNPNYLIRLDWKRC